MQDFNYEILSQCVGEDVELKDNFGETVLLTITKVCKGMLHGKEWEAFSVVFSGDKMLAVSQGTYLIRNDKFGEISLFISPNSDTEYETVVTFRKVRAA